MPSNKPRISFVIPQDIKEELEKLAESDERSVSNYVLRIIRQKIKEEKNKHE